MRILICPCRSSAFTTLAPKIGLSVKAGATTPRAATESKTIPNLFNLFIIFFPPYVDIFCLSRHVCTKKGSPSRPQKGKNMSKQNTHNLQLLMFLIEALSLNLFMVSIN